MTVIAFDTLKLARKLEAAGFQPKQAADTAEALAESMAEMSGLATKEDIHDVRREIHEVRRELAETKVELLKWLIGLIGFQTIAVLSGVAALIKLIQ